MKIKTPLALALAAGLCSIPHSLRAASGDAFLDATVFAPLGVFNPSADVLVDLSAGRMTGGASFSGALFTQAGASRLVFNFSSFNLRAGVRVIFTNAGGGSPPAVFLSQGDMTIAGTISGDGQTGVTYISDPFGSVSKGGPDGGNGNSGAAVSGFVGPAAGGSGGSYGITTNQSGLTGGGGGAYAGVGGNAGGVSVYDTNFVGFAGTNTYNADLSAQVLGGSGGGTGAAGGAAESGEGGGGGGALQIGALGSLVVSGAITANGGWGGRPASTFGVGGGGGGGSGGGILMQARDVTIQSGAVVSALGGAGGGSEFQNSDVGGGGGGGGRIYIAYHDSGATNGATISAAGGAGGYGGAGAPNNAGESGTAGTAGTVAFVQNPLTPSGNFVPAPVLSVALQAGSRAVLSWPVSAPGYGLETAAALGTGASWIPLTSGVVTNGGALFFTNSLSASADAFFRLHQR